MARKVEDLTPEEMRGFIRKVNGAFNLNVPDAFCCADYDDYVKIDGWIKELGLEPEQEEE